MSIEFTAADVTREAWAMEPRAFLDFYQRVHSYGTLQLPKAAFDSVRRSQSMSITEGVATIPISGVLLKKVPGWVRYWGIQATGYDEIAEDLEEALGSGKVKSIKLAVQSPGGMVSGVKELADAIHAAAQVKDISAEIEDLGASAAFWLASQADEITANPHAIVGSLGAYTAYVDSEKLAADWGLKIHLVASGPHKGVGTFGTPIAKEQLKPAQEMIDGIANSFAADLVRGRGLDAAAEGHKERMAEWMTGRTWLAEDAARMGLIDGIRNSGNTSPSGSAAANEEGSHTGGRAMAMDKAELAAAEEKAKGEGQAAERKRAADIRAEFPEDPAFAMEQIEKGSTVEQARGNYASVLKERNVKLQKDLESARAGTGRTEPARPAGAPPVPPGKPADAGANTADFVAEAKEYAKEHGITVRAAMSRLATEKPELFQKYREQCVAKAPEYENRKRELGVS